MEIIERIFDIMKQNKIKDIELSNKLEISKSVVSSWKTRKTNPPAEYIEKIAELLEVSPLFILTGKKITNELTQDEMNILNKYNILTERNKGKVETYIDERIEEQEKYTKDKSDLA